MTGLPALTLALPFAGAAVALMTARWKTVQRAVTLGSLGTGLLLAVALSVGVLRDGPVVTQVGGWPAGYAIPLVVDALAAPLLVAMGILSLASMVFAVTTDEDADGRYLPLVLVVSGGVTGALLTGDLFNLFVFFEVMLAGSYVLAVIRRGSFRASAVYIVTSLVASTLLLSGVALLYGTEGTVHLGQLRGAGAAGDAAGLATVVVLAALAVKSAAVPVHGWLPHAYPRFSPAVTAMFSGLLTKAGVYALLRVSTVLFDGQPVLSPMWAAVAIVTMVIGVAGALGRSDVTGILAFHMVSQIGYLIAVLALVDSPAAVAAGVYFLLQYLLVKGGLFLVGGALEHTEGSVRLRDLGALVKRHPVGAGAFFVLALSLAGVPPLSGFVAKYLLAVAAFGAEETAVGATVVAVSLFTLLSMLKIWNSAFWGEPPDHRVAAEVPGSQVPVPAGGSDDRPRRSAAVATTSPAIVFAPAVVLAVITVVAGLAAEPILRVAELGATHLLDVSAYAQVTS